MTHSPSNIQQSPRITGTSEKPVQTAGLRIPISSKVLIGTYIPAARNLEDPSRNLYSFQLKPSSELYQPPKISLVEPEKLKLGPNLDTADTYQASIQQQGPTLTTLNLFFDKIDFFASNLETPQTLRGVYALKKAGAVYVS